MMIVIHLESYQRLKFQEDLIIFIPESLESRAEEWRHPDPDKVNDIIKIVILTSDILSSDKQLW